MGMKDQRNIFYSWQSDLANSTNRGLIEDALRKAAKTIAADESLAVEAVVDRDTAGVAGSPAIATTILEKIGRADVFVPDVSLVTSAGAIRRAPNPNVLVELGYAIATLGWTRIVMVMNTAYGEPDVLPFDLRGHRVISYRCPDSPGTTRTEERRALEGMLIRAIADILRRQEQSRMAGDEANRQSLTEWAGRFRQQRLEELASGKVPTSLESGKLLCVHVVPHGAVAGTLSVNGADLDPRRTHLAPVGATGFDTAFNTDGLLRIDRGLDGKAHGYLQLFRNGVIESVDSHTMVGRGREDGLPSSKCAKDLVTFVEGSCGILREIGAQPPVSILVSLMGVLNVPLLVSAAEFGVSAYHARPFDRGKILLPEVQLDDLNAEVRTVLKPTLDALWQAAGLPRCTCYDPNGDWIAA